MEAAERRLHFLDWLRALAVAFVVYAHMVFCGAQFGRPGDGGVPDDHAYNLENPTPLAVRWIAAGRQWVIPLLFWISGAAYALSFEGKFTRGFRKLAVLTAVGVACNATEWSLGPMDENCSFRRPCPGKGILFHYTVDPYSGSIEPFVDQMWYTLMLMLMMALNWPLFRAISGQVHFGLLAMQWVATMAICGLLTFVSGDQCDAPWFLTFWLGTSEALFMALSVSPSSRAYPPWLPLRLLHYACAAVLLLQLGASPIAREPVNDLTVGWILYCVLSTKAWFQLGFLMTRPRSSRACGRLGDVQPFVSKAWPLAICLLVLCCPSTSWSMAGVLPYPLYPRVADRLLYVGGTLVALFVVDRVSRNFECRPLPDLLGRAALVLYLLQALLSSIFLHALEPWARTELGPTHNEDGFAAMLSIYALDLLSALVIAAAVGAVCGHREPSARRGVGSWAQELGVAGGSDA